MGTKPFPGRVPSKSFAVVDSTCTQEPRSFQSLNLDEFSAKTALVSQEKLTVPQRLAIRKLVKAKSDHEIARLIRQS